MTLEMLYEEVADLETTRERLLSQLKAVDKSLAAAHVRISETKNLNRNAHTSNLPSEILSSIFEAGLHTQLTSPKQWPQQGHQFEILVSHVSRRWRNVALQTPRLWSYIYLDPCTSTMELLNIYLERSSGHLLDISVRILYHQPQRLQFFRAQFRWQLATLIPHAARGGSCPSLLLAISSWIPQFSRISRFSQMSALLRLRASRLTSEDVFHTMNPTLFTGGAPVLSSVELNGYCVSLCRLPLASVTSLTLRGPTLSQEEAHMLFSPLHCLTHLYIQAHQIHYTNLPPIKLPSVISLHVFLNSCDPLGALNCLDLPAVKTLTVDENFPGRILEFSKTIHQTYPALRALKVVAGDPWGDYPQEPMHDFVAAFPDIAEGPPWPRLHTMAVTAPTLTDWATPRTDLMLSIIALIDRRIRSGYAISHLTVSKDITRQIGQEELQQLRERVVLEACAPARSPLMIMGD
ncbi:hypothetical protein JB92DRAFT_3099309 [Gautieria morchelliformis]|nr:hypothetical protein JB92DRAFT_3099309 [Gautieria morchelliformis]